MGFHEDEGKVWAEAAVIWSWRIQIPSFVTVGWMPQFLFMWISL
jgi:hypothetical protein